MGTIGIDMILRQLIKQLSFLLIVISFHVGYVSAEVEWYSVGPGGGGWIQSLACGLRKNTVYLGGDVSGFYTSETTGNDWKPQNANLQDYFIECILVIPPSVDHDRIILIGTEGGIYRWNDKTLAWNVKRLGFPPIKKYSFSCPIASLAYDPTNLSILYAGTGRPRWNKDGHGQIYRSDNYGESWSLITPPGMIPEGAIISDIEVASNGSFILAGTSRGLFRSHDKGKTWTISNKGLPHNYCEEIAISPSSPEICYLTLRTTSRGNAHFDGGVYRSENGGKSWDIRRRGLPVKQGPMGSDRRYSSSYKEIVVHPQAPDIVYVGADSWTHSGLYKTTDGGYNWKLVTKRGLLSNMDYGWLTDWGATVTSIAISSIDPQLLYFGTPGHVFISRNSGLTWQQRYHESFNEGIIKGSGLETTVATDAIFDPFNKNRVFLCYLDIGLFEIDIKKNILNRPIAGIKNPGDVFTVVADPHVKNKLWAGIGKQTGGQGNIYQSVTGGKNWKLVGSKETGLPDGAVKKIIIDSNSKTEKRILYATSEGNGVCKSYDDGISWIRINKGLPTNSKSQIVDIVINNKNSDQLRCIWAGDPKDGSGLYETINAGLTWIKVSSPDVSWADAKDLAISPIDWNTIYICQREKYDATTKSFFSGGLFKSSDGGTTWQMIYGNHFANRIVIDTKNQKTLYLGTNDHPCHDANVPIGLLMSNDGGMTWKIMSSNLSCKKIQSITINPYDSKEILLGTGGNGYFRGVMRHRPNNVINLRMNN